MALFTEQSGAELPLFRELALDADGKLLRGADGKLLRGADGQPKAVEGAEALRVWVRKALHPQSERFACCAHTPRYGNELTALTGAAPAESEARLAALIREALLVNPYITAAEDFIFSHDAAGLRAAFRVETVYGDFSYESEAGI